MNSEHNHQKKIAVINDFSGFGRCSLAVALPVISVMKIQCCPLPTSIFSNHTGFPSFFFDDYTEKMESYMEEWKKLDLRFSGICTGFLGSHRQIEIVDRFIREFALPDTKIIIDPVMGDYGKPYPTYTAELCRDMTKLIHLADILTPNLTEACILTDTPYRTEWTEKELAALAEKLSSRGPEKVVITGVPRGDMLINVCYEREQDVYFAETHKIGDSRSGTGDIFTAIIAADAVNSVPFRDSVEKASDFIRRCIEKSIEMKLPLTDGVCFEEMLGTLF